MPEALKEKRAGNLRQARHDSCLPPLDYTTFNIHCMSRLQLKEAIIMMSSFLIISGSFQKFLEYDSFIPESYSSFFLEIFSQFFQVLSSFKSWKQLEFNACISCCQKLTTFSCLYFLQETGISQKQLTTNLNLAKLREIVSLVSFILF